MLRPKLPPYQRSKSINKPSKKHIMLTNTIIKDLPNGTEPLEHQVAGHTFQMGTDEIGKYNNIKIKYNAKYVQSRFYDNEQKFRLKKYIQCQFWNSE